MKLSSYLVIDFGDIVVGFGDIVVDFGDIRDYDT